MPANARSIAALTISFGLVAIPVKLYSATVSSERLSFNLLRQKDGSRVKQQYVAVNDGEIVERAEMTKGYEFAKGQYVMFSAEELKEQGISTVTDIAKTIPNVQIDTFYPASQPNITIRGIGVGNAFGPFVTAGAGVYFDDVYMGARDGQMAEMFDLERVKSCWDPKARSSVAIRLRARSISLPKSPVTSSRRTHR